MMARQNITNRAERVTGGCAFYRVLRVAEITFGAVALGLLGYCITHWPWK